MIAIARGCRFASRLFAAMLRDVEAAVAVEFALVMPAMLLILGIGIISGEELAIGQKVTATARTVVDIVSRNSQLSTTQMTAILNAAAYTMSPYNSASLSIVVAEVQTDKNGAATVTWSAAAYGGAALATGSSVTLPASMAIANATYIYGVVTYAYTPPIIGFGTMSTASLTDSSFWSPRVSTSVNYPYPS
jgi:Flp pilus assembly protein TadG